MYPMVTVLAIAHSQIDSLSLSLSLYLSLCLSLSVCPFLWKTRADEHGCRGRRRGGAGEKGEEGGEKEVRSNMNNNEKKKIAHAAGDGVPSEYISKPASSRVAGTV